MSSASKSERAESPLPRDAPRRSAPRAETRLAARGGAVELLRVPAALFGAVVRVRRAAYDHGLLPRARVAASVISVGNLTVGGTGKTPFSAWLVRELERRGRRAGLLSRGYGAERGHGGNDEAQLLAELCPGVPHVQDPDRVRGAGALVERGVDAIVLDDGFQHRRLARDLDIVLVDATRPWGLPSAERGAPPVRALLPRGFLREPPSSLARADVIVLTRTDAVAADELEALEREIGALAPGRPIATSEHRVSALRTSTGARAELADLRGRTVELVSAIGNPLAFERTVRALGADVAAHHVFPDHHRFRREDVPTPASGAWLVATAKDAVKLAPLGFAFVTLDVELALVRGASVLEALLDALPPCEREVQRAALHEGLHG